ncbi:MAG TPA: chemotaxis protein CheB, partial [Polyangiaceae bacterium]|nr:chemotaxis protein CheB [Polyangiaceae bacterium]
MRRQLMEEAQDTPSLVAGIGASAGGLQALQELLGHLPPDTGMAFVVVTHLHRDQPTILPELLADRTAMSVRVVKSSARVEANTVYLAPPGTLLTIHDGALTSSDPDGSGRLYHPIDHFFRSLADSLQERAVGVILSGSGRDGALGVMEIKGASGLVMAQQPESARFDAMPRSAISRGIVDYILPPSKLAEQLVRYAQSSASRALTPSDSFEASLGLIMRLLRERAGHDFSCYKRSTLQRRVERRMNVHQIDDAREYARFLEKTPHEADLLFRELLIGVTSFFRDREAFERLATLLRTLLAQRSTRHVARVWVTGCASGEEAYSIGIVLHEVLTELGRPFLAQVFATDLDVQAIEMGRSGAYLPGIAADVSPERLARYFVCEDGIYRICKEIRERVIFAVQNVIKDPPFTKLDLVSCRNLLIYLNGEQQQRLLPMFHYALLDDGLLFLGPSETASHDAHYFESADKKWKIYRRRDVPAQHFAQIQNRFDQDLTRHPAKHRESAVPTVGHRAEQLLMLRFAPPSVLVSERGEVRYIHGRTGRYLEPASGEPSHNLSQMAREGLRFELPGIVRAALSHTSEVWRRDVSLRLNGDVIKVDLCACQVNEPEALRGLVLVSFYEHDQEVAEHVELPDDASHRLSALELDLQHTRESLKSTVEELETSNEELKSSNEELQSTNEELQSTNEELETSKEEMQSLNEELHAVNAELQEKVEELSRANDDMQNLLNGIEVATLFLDSDLRIMRFTPQARRVVNLIESDVGRPLSDLAANLDYTDLAKDAREVMETLVYKEREVRIGSDGESWALMRILPY